jgi:hypothetical protein
VGRAIAAPVGAKGHRKALYIFSASQIAGATSVLIVQQNPRALRFIRKSDGLDDLAMEL